MKLISSIKIPDSYKELFISSNPYFFIMLFFLILSAFSSSLKAKEIQSLEEIQIAAKIFLEEKQVAADKKHREIQIGHLDPRLRLTKCQKKLDVFLPQKTRLTGKVSIGVRCQSPVNWKIYISATLIQFQEVWILNQNLARGDILTKSNVSKQRVNLNNLRYTPVQKIAKLVNTRLKRAMRAGSVIYENNICLVCRGEKINVTAKNRFLSIHVEGVALSDASLGEQVQVRNVKSRKVFGATVAGKNQIFVKLAGTR